MVSKHSRTVKELLKSKENEVTWIQIHKVFEDVIAELESGETVETDFETVDALLSRSIMSDRSRLNGVALELLKRFAIRERDSSMLDPYLQLLMKLSGRANRIFITRAQEALVVVGQKTHIKSVIRAISEGMESLNKNVRFSAYKLVELRAADLAGSFNEYIGRGLKDPAVEVRTLCKGMTSHVAPVGDASNPPAPKKVVHKMQTPRKVLKVDSKQEVQIKQFEKDVCKIAGEPIARFSKSSESFYEKLNQIKKAKEYVAKPGNDDDLTPRRLDKYLNKYREAGERAPALSSDIDKMIAHYKQTTQSKVPSASIPISSEQPISSGKDSAGNIRVDETTTEQITPPPIEAEVSEIERPNKSASWDMPVHEVAFINSSIANEVNKTEDLSNVNQEDGNARHQESNDVIEECTNRDTGSAPSNDSGILDGHIDTNNLVTAQAIPIPTKEQEEERLHSFAGETSMFKTEMVSSHSKDTSVLHEVLSDGVINREIYSEDTLEQEDSENSLIKTCENLLEGDGASSTEIFNLSRCVANISLDPSRMEEYDLLDPPSIVSAECEAIAPSSCITNITDVEKETIQFIAEMGRVSAENDNLSMLNSHHECDHSSKTDSDNTYKADAPTIAKVASLPERIDGVSVEPSLNALTNVAVATLNNGCLPTVDPEVISDLSKPVIEETNSSFKNITELKANDLRPDIALDADEGIAAIIQNCANAPGAEVLPSLQSNPHTNNEPSKHDACDKYIVNKAIAEHDALDLLDSYNHAGTEDNAGDGIIGNPSVISPMRDEIQANTSFLRTDVYREEHISSSADSESLLICDNTEDVFNDAIEYLNRDKDNAQTVILEVIPSELLKDNEQPSATLQATDVQGSDLQPDKELLPNLDSPLPQTNSPHRIFNTQVFNDHNPSQVQTKKRPVFKISKEISEGAKLDTARSSSFIGVDALLKDNAQPANSSVCNDTVISLDDSL